VAFFFLSPDVTVRKNKFVDFVGEFSFPIAGGGITETERFRH